MKVLDLSHYISADMPVYPGTEGPRLSQATTIAREGFAEKLITMYSHTGTHMDAPGHIVEGAATLDAFDVGHFVGEAALVDVSACRGHIDLHVIESRAEAIRAKDFLILRSGWSRLWGQAAYFEGFPVLTAEAADFIVSLGVRGLGLDMISVDVVNSVDFPIHRILFRAGLVVVENLDRLEALGSTPFLFSCLPLKMPASDGSPVRAVAILG
jgi:arylformamidase